MAVFLPQNWFWLADDGRAYGSAKQLISDTSDPDYVAWSAVNNPSGWPRDLAGNQTEAEMQAVVGPYGLFVNLIYYTANARYNRASGGVIVTSLGGSVPFLSDPQSRNTVNSAFDYLVHKGSGTVQWKLSDGSFVTLDQTKITTLMSDMAGFVQSCFGVESTTVSGINGGSITTTAEVDAAFAAISNVFP